MVLSIHPERPFTGLAYVQVLKRFHLSVQELHSAWQKPEIFEVKNMKVAIEICEAGIDQQYLVYVNGNKYKAMNTFGKTINLNK